METQSQNPQNPKPQTQHDLLETLTKVLTSENLSLETLNPYTSHLSTDPNLLISLFNS